MFLLPRNSEQSISDGLGGELVLRCCLQHRLDLLHTEALRQLGPAGSSRLLHLAKEPRGSSGIRIYNPHATQCGTSTQALKAEERDTQLLSGLQKLHTMHGLIAGSGLGEEKLPRIQESEVRLQDQRPQIQVAPFTSSRQARS